MRRPGEEYGWEAGGASYRLRRVGDHFYVEQRVRDRWERVDSGVGVQVMGQHLDELTAPVPAPALASHRGGVMPLVPRAPRGGGVG